LRSNTSVRKADALQDKPKKKNKKLQITTAGDLLNRPEVIREHLITHWLRETESMLLWAPTGVGKTMFSMSLALLVAGGGKLLEWEAQRPRKVLIIDGEMHMEDLRERIKLLLNSMKELNKQAALDNLGILARQAQDPSVKFPDLAKEEGRASVFDRARNGGYDLVILDNFSTLAEIEDENSAGAMNPILQMLHKFKQVGIACVLVHHSDKGGNNYRGSSKIATTFEWIVGLTKPKNVEAMTTKFDVQWDKIRGKRDERIHQGLTLQLDERGKWQGGPAESVKCQKLIDLIWTYDYKTQEELAEAMEVSSGTLSKLKKDAINKYKLITEREWKECLKAARDEDFAGDAPEEDASF